MSARTTLPPADSPDAATDPQLAKEKLRSVDPCALLRELPLGAYGGAKGQAELDGDPSSCKQMLNGGEDDESDTFRELGVTLGAPVSTQFNKLDEKLGNLPARALQSSTSCVVSVLTDSKSSTGFQLSYADNGKDFCSAAKALAGQALDVLRRGAPQRQNDRFTAAKPCDLLDGGTVNAVLGSNPDGKNAGVYNCYWQNAPFQLDVTLKIDGPYNGAGAKPIDLGGGVQATQYIDPNEQPTCVVEWVYKVDQTPREFDGASRDEIVSVQVEDRKKAKQAGSDKRPGPEVCGKAVQAAKVVAPKLPKQ